MFLMFIKRYVNGKHTSIYKSKFWITSVQVILLLVYIVYHFATPVLAYYDDGEIKFHVYTKMKERFDDNITFSKNDKKVDVIITSSLGIDINYESKKQSFTVNSIINQNVFLNNTTLTNTSQQAELSYLCYLSRYSTLILRDIYTHAHSPLTLEADFGKDIGRYSYQQNSFYFNYIKDVNKHLSLDGMYENNYYYTGKHGSNNSLTHNIGLGLDYMINSATTLKLRYMFEVADFSIDGTSLTYTITAGLRRFITKQVYIDMAIGGSTVKPVYGKTTTNANMSVAVTDEISKTETVSLIYNKTTLPSVFSPDIFDSWKVTIKINKNLTDKAGINVAVFYGGGVFTKDATKDHQIGSNIKINYALTRNITGFIGYTYKAICSNNDSREYIRNFVELGVKLVF